MLFLCLISNKLKYFTNQRVVNIVSKRFQSINVYDDIEKLYQKKSLLEHILHRPDSYVGSLPKGQRKMWIYNTAEKKIIEKEISYSPALYKIFDEILVNALDNKLRDVTTSYIKINIDREKNSISISNNGSGIPAVMHREEGMYIPSMIFGYLLTSSNYDDSISKYTGGRNGFGAKLCNLFSTKFTVETSNHKFGHSFKQTWSDNMTVASEPLIGPSHPYDFTTVTFSPDLSRFDMDYLDHDIISLFHRRAIDVASCIKNLLVYFNDELISVTSFKDYVQLYQPYESQEIIHYTSNENWELAVTLSPNDIFTQTSFVNGIYTCNGGHHVTLVTDQIISKLHEIVKRKIKNSIDLIKPFHLKNCLWIFINCFINNPTFESQSKEYLTLLSKNFDSNCVISNDFVNKISSGGVLKRLEATIAIKRNQLLDKVSGKKKNIGIDVEKLDDALFAGSKRSKECTLILTEGDSAKTLALSGLSVIGRELYGVYPLKGKLLNVRDVNIRLISENNEFSNLVKIVGLKYNERYKTVESLDTLRYGKIMIMADQDPDGSHIKGLLINYLYFFWPELLSHGFLDQFITPLIKAFRNNSVKTFFSEDEFERWQQVTSYSHMWRIKYYKGLGTSTSFEAKEYFSNLNRHRIAFVCSNNDGMKLKMAFDKKLSGDRKVWLLKWMEKRRDNKSRKLFEEDIYAENISEITLSDFIDKELVQYSNADNERSIPSFMDGLKICQRKIIYTCLKRNLTKEIKVAQLAGSVSELCAYHHGENALYDTIIGLAQDFVGSNNINLLMPVGQFGTRVYGGKDNASSRYIFTQLSPLSRLIFNSMDDQILSYRTDNNLSIEPEWYAPVIPLILVNGCEGIGTGWRSIIPNFNPFDIINNLKRMLEGETPVIMEPWYRNFNGKIQKSSLTQYVTYGDIKSIGKNTLMISELPIKCWTQCYKTDILNKLNSKDGNGFIKQYEEHSTDTSVKIILHMNPLLMKKAEYTGLQTLLSLKSTISTNEMILFDENGRIKKFDSAEDILINFFRVRLPIYDKRKDYIEGLLSAEYKKLENQSRFINDIIEKRIHFEDLEASTLRSMLITNNYDSDPLKERKKFISKDNENKLESGGHVYDFDYLINLPMRALTKDCFTSLEKEKEAKFKELDKIRNKSSKQLWLEDLLNLETKIKEIYG